MLDLLRRKAQSWVTYIILGGLILVFALFFGYSGLGGPQARSAVATVNSIPIVQGEYDLSFDNSESYYKQVFKGTVPEQFRDNIGQTALQQLITRKLLVQFAEQHRLVISDEELAGRIRNLPFLQREGKGFDPMYYRDQIIPYYSQRYNLNFEQWLREQLLADKVRGYINSTIQVSEDELRESHRREHTEYTFEIARIDPENLVAKKHVETTEEATTAVQAVQAVFDNPQERAKLIKTYGLKVEEVGPITVQSKAFQIGELVPEDLKALFALKTDGANCPTAFKVGETWVACRLLKRSTPTTEAFETSSTETRQRLVQQQQQSTFDRWLQGLTAQATITRRTDL